MNIADKITQYNKNLNYNNKLFSKTTAKTLNTQNMMYDTKADVKTIENQTTLVYNNNFLEMTFFGRRFSVAFQHDQQKCKNFLS